MKKVNFNRVSLAAGGTLGVLALSLGNASALSAAAGASTNTADSTRLQTIISSGDKEISRRLTSLNNLSTKINGMTKLSSSDKASLTSEVNSTISGLNSLKTKLDGETTLTAAKADAQSIFTEYRVYAVVLPKVNLVRVADDELVTESKLTALATKLQTSINTAKTKGKDVTTLQNDLDDLNSKVSAAQAISNSVEAKVLAVQPSDYNSDHTVLSGYRDQLKTAHSDNQTAATDAKNIIAGLK